MKAKALLKSILDDRHYVYTMPNKDIEEAIKEIEKIQDETQIKILELKAEHKKEINKLKVKFIEDIKSLSEVINDN